MLWLPGRLVRDVALLLALFCMLEFDDAALPLSELVAPGVP